MISTLKPFCVAALRTRCSALTHKLFHPLVGQRAQGRPDFRTRGSDAEGGFADLRMGDRHHGEILVERTASSERGERRHQFGHHAHGRDPGFGHRGVSGLAVQDDAHAAGGAIHRPFRQRHLAEREAWKVMEGEGKIRRQLAKPRIGDDGGCAGPILLRRLEQQDGPAALRTSTAEQPRQAGRGWSCARHVRRDAPCPARRSDAGISEISSIGSPSSSARIITVGPGCAPS